MEGFLAVLGEIRGGGPVWDVESGSTVCVLVADCQWPQSRARLKPETMRVTFEEFSPTHNFFDYMSLRNYCGGQVTGTIFSPYDIFIAEQEGKAVRRAGSQPAVT